MGEICSERNKTCTHGWLRQIKEAANAPYCIDLILYFLRLHLLLQERQYVLKFLHAPCLETRRVVEDKLRVAPEGELVIYIMNPSLQQQSQRPDQRNA